MKQPKEHRQTWSATLPTSDLLDLAIVSKTVRKVGGDYYDFYRVSENQIGFILADVSGHGEQAALHVAVMKSIFRDLIATTHQPAVLAARANEAVMQRFDEATFVTALFMLLRLDQMSLSVVRCGHCFPLLYRHETQQVEILESEGIGLGITREGFEHHLTECTTEIGRKDMLLACTDGALESRNKDSGEEFGLDQLMRTFAQVAQGSAKHAVDRLLQAVLDIEPENQDDITLMALRFK